LISSEVREKTWDTSPVLQARRATANDAPEIARIHDEVVRERVTLDTAPVGEGVVREWIAARHPVAVVLDGPRIIGFAVSEPHRIRSSGGARVGELGVYVSKAFRRRGAGRLAVAEIIGAGRVMGGWKLLAHALADNAPARALLAALDFRHVGMFEKHVQIDSLWRDVAVYERLLMTARKSSGDIRPISS
jgi:L-amino acid N-acyltransferase YncA